MDSISDYTPNLIADISSVQRDELKRFIDFRYYRRFYLNKNSSIEDAVEDFVARGWQHSHNLNPFLHTRFVKSYYSDQIKSLSDFLDLITKPIYLNALCSKEIDVQALRIDIQRENENYAHFKRFFDFDVESYCSHQDDIRQHAHFQSILYHLFFIGLSQNRLRKFGYLKAISFSQQSTDLECLLARVKPFCLNSNSDYADHLSDVFDPGYYRSRHDLNLDSWDELIDHFFTTGWSKNLDPHPYVHLCFIKKFYNLSSDLNGLDQFTQLVQKQFIPNALVKQPVGFSEFLRCLDSFDIHKQSELIAIDVERLTRDRYSCIRHAKMSALKHLYLFGLEQNFLSENGYLKDFFLPRFTGINDYEFLANQAQPIGVPLADNNDLNQVTPDIKLALRLVIGVVLYKNSLSEVNRLLMSIMNNIDCNFSKISLVFYDNSPSEYCLSLDSLSCEILKSIDLNIIHDSSNCGFSLAHNRLMELCFDQPDSLYLGLNPDGYLLPSTLKKCYSFLKSKNKSFLCEINTEPMAHPKWYHPHTGQTDWVSGVAFFIDESAFSLLKGFDPSFPMYCEDVDLSFRAYECGVSLFVTPFFGFYHDTTERQLDVESNIWRSVRSLIGEWYLCQKWGNLERVLDLEKLMISRNIKLDQLPERPKSKPNVHPLVYDLVRSPRYSRSVY